MSPRLLLLATAAAALHLHAAPSPSEELFVAAPLTAENSFTAGVEGPASDRDGNVYAVAFQQKQNIGKVTMDGHAELFVTLPERSTGNGIRFGLTSGMFVADYTGHNILRVDTKTKEVTVFAHEDRMSQPNDIAIAPDDTIYASDPNWKAGTGQVWRIDGKGRVTLAATDMGTTNGIEVSPDGQTLYVNETVQRNIWAFEIERGGTLRPKHLVKKFDDFGMDGMRCDIDGNLYVTRHGKGTVVKLSPDGDVLKEIAVLGENPTNICFAGPDGRVAVVTEAQHKRLVRFRVDRAGAEFERKWKPPVDLANP